MPPFPMVQANVLLARPDLQVCRGISLPTHQVPDEKLAGGVGQLDEGCRRKVGRARGMSLTPAAYGKGMGAQVSLC